MLFDKSQHPQRFTGYPQCLHSIAVSNVQYEMGDGWMKVAMLVTVNVVKLQSGGSEDFELRINFICDLPAHRRVDKYPDAGRNYIVTKAAGLVDQIGHARGRQHRASVGQNDVQPDLQRTQPPRSIDCVGGGGRPDHETGRRQDAVPVSRLNRLVNFERKTEVVGRYNQLLQCATPRRSRRK